jgi:hypothetical protein
MDDLKRGFAVSKDHMRVPSARSFAVKASRSEVFCCKDLADRTARLFFDVGHR